MMLLCMTLSNVLRILFPQYQFCSFSQLLSPHPSSLTFQAIRCSVTEDLKTRIVTLNVTSFGGNLVICLVHICIYNITTYLYIYHYNILVLGKL